MCDRATLIAGFVKTNEKTRTQSRIYPLFPAELNRGVYRRYDALGQHGYQRPPAKGENASDDDRGSA
jgi:hypothetical protein